MKKRISAIFLAVAMVLGLVGCSATLCSVSINSDGSGMLGIKCGLTQEGLETLAAGTGSESWEDMLQAQAVVPFTESGVTYYGVSEQHGFADLDELARLLDTMGNSSDAGIVVSTDGLQLTQNKADGSFELVLDGLGNETTTGTASTQLVGSGVDAAKLEELKDQMVIKFSFTFPSAVVQTMGAGSGVTISGNTVTVDALKMEGKCKFSTSADAVTQRSGPFTDVALNAWYCPAVSALSNGGLINGTGNGAFQPAGIITYAEFAQILAKAKGLPVGTKDGYWAGVALENCVNNGYFDTRGAFTPANYAVPMSREAAVSALMKAIPGDLLAVVNVDPVIPDLNTVSSEFQSLVLESYRYGISKGTGDGTFNPKGTLTRAEACQLLYNIGWTSPAK